MLLRLIGRAVRRPRSTRQRWLASFTELANLAGCPRQRDRRIIRGWRADPAGHPAAHRGHGVVVGAIRVAGPVAITERSPAPAPAGAVAHHLRVGAAS